MPHLRKSKAPSTTSSAAASIAILGLAWTLLCLLSPSEAHAGIPNSCPAAPSCASLPNAPAELTERLPPGAHVLFYGDSITKRNEDTTFHYAKLIQHLFSRTYNDYCLTPIAFTLDGEEGRKPYAKNNSKHISQTIEKGVPPYDWAFVQDSGAPTDPDQYAEQVETSISLALDIDPPAQIILATAHPLDESETTSGNCRRYVRACNWAASNEILEFHVANEADPRLHVLPLANDACQIVTLSGIKVTNDGVHLGSIGSLVYALSLFRFFGGELSEIPDCAFTMNDGFPFNEDLDQFSGSRVRDVLIEERDGNCRMAPSCYANFLGEAQECIAHCAQDGRDCAPYFTVVGACCGDLGCLDFVNAEQCSSNFSGTWAGEGTICTPGCCGGGGCTTPTTTTSTTSTTLGGPTEGACCIAGNCSDEVLSTTCTNNSGVFMGTGTICTPSCCDGGACFETTTTTTTSTTTTTTSTTTTSTSSTTTTTTLPPCGSQDWLWEGDEAAAYGGSSVAVVGDLNDDGRAEVAIGLPGSDRDHAQGGGVIVVDGESGAPLLRIPGFEAGARSGSALAAIGDGHTLLVGAPGVGSLATEGAGRIEAWDLSEGAELVASFNGTESRTALGATLAPFGDSRRFLVGSPRASNGAGRVSVFELSNGTISEVATFDGDRPGDQLGASLAAFGDGILMVVGAPGANGAAGPESGKAAIYSAVSGSGRPPLIVVEGSEPGMHLGAAVAASRETWAVGAPAANLNRGQVWVLGIREEDPSAPIAIVHGAHEGARFGSQLLGTALDLERMVTSSPLAANTDDIRAGSVSVLDFADTTLSQTVTIFGERYADRSGKALAATTNDEVLIGIPGADGLQVDETGIRHRVHGGGAVALRKVCP